MDQGWSDDDLREAIQLACQPQNTHRIVAGRERILAMPRHFVLERIEQIAVNALNLSDSWEYRRLLEVARLLDPELVRRLVKLGAQSTDPDVKEASDDFA